MTRHRVFLSIILLGAALFVHAEDLQPSGSFHRLEYVHFDSGTQTVEWGVSEGAVNEAGDYVPNGSALAVFSLELKTGVMTHEGENGRLSSTDADGAAQAFYSLSQLVQAYTDHWRDPSDPAPREDLQQDHQRGGSVKSDGPVLRNIAAPCQTNGGTHSAEGSGRDTGMIEENKATITQRSRRTTGRCNPSGSQPPIEISSAAIRGHEPTSNSVLASSQFLPLPALILGGFVTKNREEPASLPFAYPIFSAMGIPPDID